MEFFTHLLERNEVQYWFDLINNSSFFYIIIPFFIIELIRYTVLKRISWNLIGDSIANLITFVAFIVIETIIAALFIYKLYFWVYDNFSLPHLPLNWITIICCVLLADFAYYWDHRVMHRVGIGWATHTAHHSSPHFNMSVAYRFGPLDAVFPILFSLPIAMLGFNPWLIFASEVLVQVYQTVLHTEVIGKLWKPIEYLFNTPSHHRVHHGSNDQYLDKNYGGILIIWDRWLGTFAEEQEKVVYGITEPIKSVNPFVVSFHGFQRLFKSINNTKGFRNKALRFIKPPDWNPSEGK